MQIQTNFLDRSKLDNQVINFWHNIISLAQKKKWKSLLILAKKIIQTNEGEINPGFNLYAFLLLKFVQNDEMVKDCFKKLLELELQFPADLIVKFNICNFLMKFKNFEESEMYIKELEKYLPHSSTIKYMKILNEEQNSGKEDVNKIVEFIKENPNYEKGYIKAIILLIKQNEQELALRLMGVYLEKFQNQKIENKINLVVFEEILKSNNDEMRKLKNYLLIEQNQKKNCNFEFFQFNEAIFNIKNNNEGNAVKSLEELFHNTQNKNLKLLVAINLIVYYEKHKILNKCKNIIQLVLKQYENQIDLSDFIKKLQEIEKQEILSLSSELSLETSSEEEISQQNHRKSNSESIHQNDFEMYLEDLIQQPSLQESIIQKNENLKKQLHEIRSINIEEKKHFQNPDDYYQQLVNFVLKKMVLKKENKKLSKLKQSMTQDFVNASIELKNFTKDQLLQLLEEDPLNKEYLLKLAYCYLEEDNIELFKQNLCKIFQQDPKYKPDLVMYSFGLVYYLEGDFDKSLYFFSINYKLSVRNRLNCLLFIGKIYFKQKIMQKAIITFEKMNRSFPDNYIGYYWLGKIYFILQNYKDAEMNFQVLLQKEHNHYKTLTYLAIMKIQQNLGLQNIKQIKTLFQKALENPKTNKKFLMKIYLNYSEMYEKIGNFESAIKYQELAYKIQPENQELIHSLAKNYIKQKKFKEVLKIYKKTLKIYPKDIFIASKLGVLYAYFCNYQKAIKYFYFVKNLEPNHYESNFILGKIQRDVLQSPALALKCFEVIDQKNRGDIKYELGLTYMKMNQTENALKILNKGIEENPNFEENYLLLGDYYFQIQDFLKSKRFYESVQSLNKTSEKSICGILLCNLQLLEFEKNIILADSIDYFQVKNPAIFISVAQSFILINPKNQIEKEKNFQKGEQFLLLAAESTNSLDFQQTKEIVRMFYSMKNYEQGLNILQGLKGRENSEEFYFDLSFGYFKINKNREAFIYLKKCIQMNHKNPKYKFLLAQIFVKNQFFDKALEILELLKVDYPKIMKTFYLIAEIYERMKKTDKANQVYQEISSLNNMQNIESLRIIILKKIQVEDQKKENKKVIEQFQLFYLFQV